LTPICNKSTTSSTSVIYVGGFWYQHLARASRELSYLADIDVSAKSFLRYLIDKYANEAKERLKQILCSGGDKPESLWNKRSSSLRSREIIYVGIERYQLLRSASRELSYTADTKITHSAFLRFLIDKYSTTGKESLLLDIKSDAKTTTPFD
jgi:hypothetical protein